MHNQILLTGALIDVHEYFRIGPKEDWWWPVEALPEFERFLVDEGELTKGELEAARLDAEMPQALRGREM